jgi:hypothetical protein
MRITRMGDAGWWALSAGTGVCGRQASVCDCNAGTHQRQSAGIRPGETYARPLHTWLVRYLHATTDKVPFVRSLPCSLIRSLIQRRSCSYVSGQQTPVTSAPNGPELAGTAACRVGKRVGGNPSRVRISYPPHRLTSRNVGPDSIAVGPHVVRGLQFGLQSLRSQAKADPRETVTHRRRHRRRSTLPRRT